MRPLRFPHHAVASRSAASACLVGIVLVVLVKISTASWAQTTAGVPGPVVNEGHEAVQFRLSFDPDSDFFAQRIHYEKAVNGQLMLRGIVSSKETATSSQEFDFFQAEAFVQLTPDSRSYQSGLRFDARVRDKGSTGLFGLHWLQQFRLSDRATARFDILNFVEAGGRARSGVRGQTRANLFWRFEPGNVGIEMFSSYGKWSDMASTDDQSHQLGPFITRNLTKNWNLFVGALFGLTDGSADTAARIWLTRRF